MAKKIEMIVSYRIEGDDFIYNDNHGVLTRCKDCKHKQKAIAGIPGYCGWFGRPVKDDFYCADGERRETE